MRSVSRAHTPPPAFLPAGPTLIQTQFHHGLLLPMSVPLRHSDTDVDVTMGISAPLSAPTPVSPAAILGAPSERSKALEGAAQVLIREVVENRLWGECWRASVVAALGSTKHMGDIWTGDIRAAGRLIASVEGTQSSLDIGRTFVSGKQKSLYGSRLPSQTTSRCHSRTSSAFIHSSQIRRHHPGPSTSTSVLGEARAAPPGRG